MIFLISLILDSDISVTEIINADIEKSVFKEYVASNQQRRTLMYEGIPRDHFIILILMHIYIYSY